MLVDFFQRRSIVEYNSVNDVVAFLQKSNFKSESEIQIGCWDYDRYSDLYSNKKYAELLRRGLEKGLYKRVKVEGKRFKYVYYI